MFDGVFVQVPAMGKDENISARGATAHEMIRESAEVILVCCSPRMGIPFFELNTFLADVTVDDGAPLGLPRASMRLPVAEQHPIRCASRAPDDERGAADFLAVFSRLQMDCQREVVVRKVNLAEVASLRQDSALGWDRLCGDFLLLLILIRRRRLLNRGRRLGLIEYVLLGGFERDDFRAEQRGARIEGVRVSFQGSRVLLAF